MAAIADATGICKNTYNNMEVLNWDDTAALLEATTGWPLDGEEVRRIGERIVNLERLFLAREGITRRDDRLPKRFVAEPLADSSGASSGAVLELEPMLDEYYQARGWDVATGLPTAAENWPNSGWMSARRVWRLPKGRGVYELKVAVTKVMGTCMPADEAGDYFCVRDGALSIPEGGFICLWALQSLMPVLTAKERRIAEPQEVDWVWRVLATSSALTRPARVIFRIVRSGEADAPPFSPAPPSAHRSDEVLGDLRVCVSEGCAACAQRGWRRETPSSAERAAVHPRRRDLLPVPPAGGAAPAARQAARHPRRGLAARCGGHHLSRPGRQRAAPHRGRAPVAPPWQRTLVSVMPIPTCAAGRRSAVSASARAGSGTRGAWARRAAWLYCRVPARSRPLPRMGKLVRRRPMPARMHADEILTDRTLVRRLLRAQFRSGRTFP